MICSFFFIYFCPLRILIINLTIMKRKATLLFLVTFVLLLGAVAQEKLKTVIEPLQNERWWGGFVALDVYKRQDVDSVNGVSRYLTKYQKIIKSGEKYFGW